MEARAESIKTHIPTAATEDSGRGHSSAAFAFDLKGVEVGKSAPLTEINQSLGLKCKLDQPCVGLATQPAIRS